MRTFAIFGFLVALFGSVNAQQRWPMLFKIHRQCLSASLRLEGCPQVSAAKSSGWDLVYSKKGFYSIVHVASGRVLCSSDEKVTFGDASENSRSKCLYEFKEGSLRNRRSSLCIQARGDGSIFMNTCRLHPSQTVSFYDSELFKTQSDFIGSSVIDRDGKFFRIVSKIGSGSSGTVYKAVGDGNSEIAVKVFAMNKRIVKDTRFDKEIALNKRVDFYLGSGLFHDPHDGIDKSFILMIWVTGDKPNRRTLDKWQKSGKVSAETIIDAMNIARRRLYEEKRIIHSDLSFGNSLMNFNHDGSVSATIIDFGDSKFRDDLSNEDLIRYIQKDNRKLRESALKHPFLAPHVGRIDMMGV